ncbi:hypothetical protein QYF61_009570 [Mycteria americana]|uniref:Uncharacterized protein n=1 Tax=Mycteria americana TaxID=33587 RepID=A0AAN7NJF6_MYCAM|nr:hypothetical protein QYF61_009570 [Mycteria americana]
MGSHPKRAGCRSLSSAIRPWQKVGPLLKAVKVPLDGIPSLKCINVTTQLGVICKLAEGALNPTAYAIDEDIDPSIKPIHLQFRDKNVVGDRIKGFTEVQGLVACVLKASPDMVKEGIQHLGWCNPGCTFRLGDKRLECPLQKGFCGFWLTEGYKNIRMCPKQSNKDGERTRGHEEWLRIQGLLSLEKRRLKGDLIAVCDFLMRGSGEGSADLFSLLSGDRMRGNGSKLHQGKFRLDIREKFFTERVVTHWNKCPREVVMAPSLLVFEKHLDKALRDMI